MYDLVFLDSSRKMPLMTLPVRTTVVRLANAVVMIAPGSGLSEAELASAGDVTDLVASNLFHCSGIERAAKVFPKARVWGPASAKREKPSLPWTHIFGTDLWPHESELGAVEVGGIPRMEEVVFFERGARTLIVTDLLFNMREPKGIGPWIILHVFGTYNRLALSRLFLKTVEDREAFAKSLRTISELNFADVVVNHGEIAKNAKSEVLAAFKERGF